MTTAAKADHPPAQGVLDALDSHVPGSFYWYLALLACIGGFLFGYDTADIGSALPFIPSTCRTSPLATSSRERPSGLRWEHSLLAL
jgi:hypothetical protein